ncbi:multidrug effflux MFS transporter [Saccharicrinis sp. FJH2]|uniref:multidrug effflux MFS transporter n=1 Tax=Saccharicrinis sp. FJH65 TaxID=3344659 RepID=UPI0035F41082
MFRMTNIPESLSNEKVKNRFKTILILGILTAYVPFSIDSYLPAVPNIAEYFGTSTARMTFSLTTFFIGFSLGQIIYGPLLDRVGRKKPLYVGVTISILASIACIFSWSASSFILFRFIQALGASVASVSALAMVRDFFPPEESSKIFSLLVLVIGSSPLLAPYLGSHIMQLFNWHWIFAFLILIGIAVMSLVKLALPTGYIPDEKATLKIRTILKNYREIITNPQFLIYAIGGAFSFASLFIYVAGSPIIFMEHYHFTPKTFGYVFAGLAIGFIGGSQLNILMLKYFSSQKIFRFALISQFIIGIIYFAGVANQWFDENMNIVFLFFVLLCIGFTSPNGIALALAPIHKNLGSASALVGMIRIGVAGLTSASIGLLNATNSIPVAGMISSTAFISLIIMTFGLKRMKSIGVEVVEK